MKIQDLILSFFEKAHRGCLRLTLPDGQVNVYGEVKDSPPVDLTVNDPNFFRRVALKGDIGLGESYIEGEWDSSAPAALLGWFIKNKDALMSDRFEWAMPMISRLAAWQERFLHRKNANTKAGSKRNIEAHYDLGNDFYELFLDESMTYSSAYFRNPTDSLQQAQLEKYDRICRKLDLGPADRVLEIGCGWGGFAVYAAENYGCSVTGITLSPSQYDYAVARVQKAGLSHKVEIQQIDYRDMRGQFDKLVSIEMIEAVGHEHLPSYFAAIDRLLKPDGLSCIQIIMSADHRYKSYRKTSDYIRKHIFPGSHLPSIGALFEAKERADLNLYHMESFGLHYARTLELWRDRFEKSWPQIKSLGFPETFHRKWRLYFDYCIAGFKERHINLAQVVFGRLNCESYRFEQSDFADRAESTLRFDESLLETASR
ncbi:cyclopropane-fatty-acyl-phospholipid synthase family protein [Pelagicoccus sp. SDUM812005]|uniref:cyclopropane-fatty-acyl-phospholipid synthase family protein n=1 Tax=Pelagicoccus sp. SDUM812005 TaxID=3041257 RepID=UPI00280E8002|nr:cyclopropane-fatty-acyl-phospholipid synthase family protein [Pelagicoccus sp. SDUM812005]MDQ8179529.1 cyclopropane-fatty-acyl-phospholipid synthase [Pelagicoccus sp. SDUM812005]